MFSKKMDCLSLLLPIIIHQRNIDDYTHCFCMCSDKIRPVIQPYIILFEYILLSYRIKMFYLFCVDLNSDVHCLCRCLTRMYPLHFSLKIFDSCVKKDDCYVLLQNPNTRGRRSTQCLICWELCGEFTRVITVLVWSVHAHTTRIKTWIPNQVIVSKTMEVI